MYVLQVLNCEKYSLLSYKNKTRAKNLQPLRGKILDVNGQVIAANQVFYKILCYPNVIKDKKGYLIKLMEYFPDLRERFDSIKRDLYNRKIYSFVLFNDSSWQKITKVEHLSYDLPGTSVEKFYRRFYPHRNVFSHILGYIVKCDKKTSTTQYLGKAGIEFLYDDLLQGTPGLEQYEVNSKGYTIRKLSDVLPITGHDLHLSLDTELTHYINQSLRYKKFKSASVVVMDIKTGELKSLVSLPSYDNNMFSFNIDHKEWKNLNDNDCLFHRAVALRISPGSTFKIISALAALETGIIDPQRTLSNCRGSVKIGGRTFKCWNKKSGHGYIALDRALASSCNIYFYDLAKKIELDSLVEIAEQLCPVESVLGLKEELGSVFPNKNWRSKHLNNSWYLGDTVNLLIGHGYILTTPLHLAIMIARFASGKQVVPTLLKQSSDEVKFQDIGISTRNLRIVQKSIYNAVNSTYGTAYKYRLDSLKFAGKTGTVQIISSHNAQHKTDLQYHSLFVGYAPYHDPKYAISIVLERGGYGKESAFIANRVFNYLNSR